MPKCQNWQLWRYIIDEGALDKVLTVPESTLDAGKPGNVYEVIDYGYFK